MTEIVFYRLSGQSLDRSLPTLLEKCLERGWRVVVQTASEERVDALDLQVCENERQRYVISFIAMLTTLALNFNRNEALVPERR